MILTGKRPPRERIVDHIKQIDIPILYAPMGSYHAMKLITNFTAKIRKEDTKKVERAIEIVSKYTDFETLCL